MYLIKVSHLSPSVSAHKAGRCLDTVGPLLSDHLCDNSIIKVFRLVNLSAQVKLCSTTLIEHTLGVKYF